MRKFVKMFEEMTKEDSQEAGGKAANLVELAGNGFNVPPGFCVTSESLFHLINHNDLQPKIDAIVSTLDYEDYEAMEKKTGEIRDQKEREASFLDDDELDIPAFLRRERKS